MKFIFRFKNKRFEITFDDSLFLLGVIWFPTSENNLSEEVDVAGHVVVHDQRKIGAGVLQLRFGARLHVGIDRESDLVGLIDWRRLRLLLRFLGAT